MAYIRKTKTGRWQVQIHKRGFPQINKNFIDLKVARRFAKDVELKMEKNEFEDYSGARGTTLKEILIKYRDEKTVLKKGYKEETCTINFLIKRQANCLQAKKRVEYLRKSVWDNLRVNPAALNRLGEKSNVWKKESQEVQNGLRRWRFGKSTQSYGNGLPDGWQCRCEKSAVICRESWKYDAGFCTNAET